MIRIVKMVFRPEEVDNFEKLFDEVKERIRSFEGCTHLSLLRDKNQSETFFTYSRWNDESDLESYRNSDLFKSVWSRTKVKFGDKPEAWSVDEKIILP